MNEIDHILVNESDNCTIYTIQFRGENASEFEHFTTNSKTMRNTIPTSYVSWHL